MIASASVCFCLRWLFTKGSAHRPSNYSTYNDNVDCRSYADVCPSPRRPPRSCLWSGGPSCRSHREEASSRKTPLTVAMAVLTARVRVELTRGVMFSGAHRFTSSSPDKTPSACWKNSRTLCSLTSVNSWVRTGQGMP